VNVDFERFQRAIGLRDSGGEEAALHEFEALVSSESDSYDKASLLLNQANCLWRLGRLREARERLAESMSLWATPFAEFLDACLCISEGKKEEAVRKLTTFLVNRTALRESGDEDTYGAAQDELGRLLFELGRYADAIGPLEGALTLADEDQRKMLCFYLGVCQYENRHWQAAEQRLIESLPTDHRDPWWRQAQFYLGLCHFATGDLETAERELFQSLPDDLKDPSWGPVQYQLGRVHFQRGAYSQAKQAFEMVEFVAADSELEKNVSRWLVVTCAKLGEGNRPPS
jgi:tetratricopeptide (TPR) repeat protein